jgi:hypothetical protein
MAESHTIAAAPQMKHIDRPDVSEVYVDGVYQALFDGVNIRIEFIVNRLDELQPPAQPTGSQLTAARLVVPVAGFMGMLQHFNTLVGNLKAPGRLAYRANPDAADLRSTPLIVSIVTPQ